MTRQDTHNRTAASAISSPALNIEGQKNKWERREESKQSRPMSCILNLLALPCPLLSLRTNELPLEVIVLPLRHAR